MKVLEIFEKVNLTVPIEQRRFFNHLEDTVDELKSMYRRFVTEDDKEYIKPEDINGEIIILPLYKDAIVENILFLATNEEPRKSEFIRKSRQAFLRYWSEHAKGKRIKRGRW